MYGTETVAAKVWRSSGLRRYALATLILCLSVMMAVQPVAAAMVGTPQLLEGTERTARLERIERLLTQELVRSELERQGITADEASRRIHALTDAELQVLAERLDELPAGGSGLGILGATFLVLLVLEVLGVTNVFSRI